MATDIKLIFLAIEALVIYSKNCPLLHVCCYVGRISAVPTTCRYAFVVYGQFTRPSLFISPITRKSGVPRGGNLLWTHSRGLNNYNNIHGLIMSKLLVACIPYLAAQLQLAQCMNIIIINITSSCKHFLGRTQTIICTDTAACIVTMYTILLNC